MKHRVFSLCCALVLALACVLPALAAEPVNDVSVSATSHAVDVAIDLAVESVFAMPAAGVEYQRTSALTPVSSAYAPFTVTYAVGELGVSHAVGSIMRC